MDWIYLALFVLVVLLPKIINGDQFFLREDDQESILIFVVGTAGLCLFLWKERQLRFHLREKVKIQKEASRVSRDLADSYSYIAEINRKMDILKNIALDLPETGSVTPERMKEVYESITEALSLLGKTDSFCLSIVDLRSGKVEKKLEGSGESCPVPDFRALSKRSESVIKEGEYIIIKSPKRVKGHLAFVVLRKKNGDLEDPEIFKALAAQALFLDSIEREQPLSLSENNV